MSIITRSQIKIPPEAEQYLQIRYLKLHFYLEILEDGIMPHHKASALRGGMGRMLLMMNCIREENCEVCDFEEDCLVRRMMYPRMIIRPAFMTQKSRDSEGYVLECEDTEEEFQSGDILEFNLILLGRTIVYFTQFLQAFHYLGLQGLGKYHVPFRVKSVTNSRGKVVVDGGDVYKANLHVMQLEEYVRYRLSRLRLEKDEGDPCRLVFHSPLTLKHGGQIQKAFSPEALAAAVERRLYILNCYEGRQEEKEYNRIRIMDHIPVLLDQHSFQERVPRYSGTHHERVSLNGIKGYCELTRVDAVMESLLIAGELVHIGKNTSFGFGRYTMVDGS